MNIEGGIIETSPRDILTPLQLVSLSYLPAKHCIFECHFTRLFLCFSAKDLIRILLSRYARDMYYDNGGTNTEINK